MKRFGCINWHSAQPDTYFGNYTLKALSHFPKRLPYYAEKTGSGYRFPERTQEDYDRELQYAIQAGIDFFAHCWYAEEEVTAAKDNPGSDYLGTHIYELSWARKMHLNSPYREQIKLCAIIGAYELNDRDYDQLCLHMKEDYYEKTEEGRPLVFVFNAMTQASEAEVVRLKEHAARFGVDPYLVGCIYYDGVLAAPQYIQGYDAFSAYAETSLSDDFNDFVRITLRDDEQRGEFGLPSIPLYSAGWDPTPRIKSPVPWVEYNTKLTYLHTMTAEELIEEARLLKDWCGKHQDICHPDYVLMFAWNEFEEGGWICPTLNEDGTPNTERVQAIGQAIKLLRQE